MIKLSRIFFRSDITGDSYFLYLDTETAMSEKYSWVVLFYQANKIEDEMKEWCITHLQSEYIFEINHSNILWLTLSSEEDLMLVKLRFQ